MENVEIVFIMVNYYVMISGIFSANVEQFEKLE